jgi:hypothetical protein
MTGIPWQSWAPPLDPPTAGGLPEDQAQVIADACWDDDPHLCAALQWEAYAATLPQSAAVQSVHTGMQSVAYYPPIPGGEFGLAMARAEWHRAFLTFQAVPLQAVVPDELELHPRVWQGIEP